jgi:hypothetical protein
MRWTHIAGRNFCATSGACADGEVVWSWRSDAGAKSVEPSTDDGGNQAWSPGRSRISRKTIAQGRPDDSACTCGSAACFFYCTRTMGAVGTRPSLRPLHFRGRHISNTSDISCRENEQSCFPALSCSAKAGHPVPTGLTAQSKAPLEYWIARSSRATTTGSVAWPSRGRRRMRGGATPHRKRARYFPAAK